MADLAFEGPRYSTDAAVVFRQALDHVHGQKCRNCREQRQTSRRAGTDRLSKSPDHMELCTHHTYTISQKHGTHISECLEATAVRRQHLDVGISSLGAGARCDCQTPRGDRSVGLARSMLDHAHHLSTTVGTLDQHTRRACPGYPQPRAQSGTRICLGRTVSRMAKPRVKRR